jgi:hypothetical protein
MAVNAASNTVLTNLDNREVTRADASSPWTYSPVQDWPELGNSVNFFAVTTNDASSAPSIALSGGAASITYAVPTAAADQKDLLAAVKPGVAVPVSGATSMVNLNFQHTLSRIVLKVRNSGSTDSIKVEAVKLLNLKPEGTLALTDANVPDGAITYPGTPASGVITAAANFTDVLGAGVGAGGSDNSIIILPTMKLEVRPLTPAQKFVSFSYASVGLAAKINSDDVKKSDY